MKKLLLFLCILGVITFYSMPSYAQTNVVINELSQGDTGDHEWIELVVTVNGTDLSGLYITSSSANYTKYGTYDFPSSVDLSVGLQFNSDPLFQNLQKGQVIVIYKAPTTTPTAGDYDPTLGGGTGTRPTTDISFADGNGLLIASDNSTYFSGVWPGLKNWNTNPATSHGDAVGLLTSSAIGVFEFSYGDGTVAPTTSISTNYGTLVLPTGFSLASGQEAYFTSSNPSDASNNSFWSPGASSSATPKILNTGTNNTSLPVELTSFSASVNGTTVNLTWKTATEVNNYGFDVERSSGNSAWSKIGFVAGSGNSNSPKSYSFTDSPTGGTTFSYRLKQIDVGGSFKYYDPITVNLAVSSEPQLMQNSPNPFNPSTTIKFYIPNTSDVSIKIYDILGREVNTLINQQTTAGYHIVYWNGKNSRGENVSSGIYLYRLTAGSFSETKKMNLLK